MNTKKIEQETLIRNLQTNKINLSKRNKKNCGDMDIYFYRLMGTKFE